MSKCCIEQTYEVDGDCSTIVCQKLGLYLKNGHYYCRRHLEDILYVAHMSELQLADLVATFRRH